VSHRGVYRSVYSALLDDIDFQNLSPSSRLLFFTLRLGKQSGPAAIFRYYPAVLAQQTGLRSSQITRSLKQLRDTRWIEYDPEHFVVWVRNALRYDPTMNLAHVKQRLGVERALAELPRCQIVLNFCEYYKIAKPFESLSKGGRPPFPSESDSDYRVPNNYNGPVAPTGPLDLSGEILEFLNQKAGRTYRQTATHLDLIRARLRDGIAPWQLRAIVSRKVHEWRSTEMAKYLRPATLFNRTKCEQYLGELPAPPPATGGPDA